MAVILPNNAETTLATAINASETSLVVADGSVFPSLSAGQHFYATLVSTQGTLEIVKVTARSGNILTVTRGAESTTPNGFAVGTRVEARVTAASVKDGIDELRADLAASSGSSLVGYTQGASGASARTVQDKLRESVSVKDFGAVGDGVTDDAVAIQAALDYCSTSGNTLYFPSGTYNSSQAHTMTNTFSLVMDGTMVYTGSSAITFLEMTGASGRNQHRIKLTAQTTDWSDDDFIGLHVYGAVQTIFDLYIYGFARGARLGGSDQFAYNLVYPTFIAQNRIGLDLNSITSAGYVNQNTFIGGRITTFSDSSLNSISRIGIRLTDDLGAYEQNNNLFINQSFELLASATTGGATSIPILAEYALLNQFIGCRCEGGATGAAVVEKNDSRQNQYDFLYCDASAAKIDYQGTYRNSIFRNALNTTQGIDATPHLVFDSGPLYQRANLYDGSTSTFVDGVHVQGSSSGSPSTATNAVTINSDNLSYGGSRALGVFIDVPSSNQTKFYVDTRTKSGSCGLYVACFDSSGNRLTSAGANAPYITASPNAGTFYSSDYGGAYSFTAAGVFYFTVAKTDVAKIQILLNGASSPTLQSFSIWSSSQVNVYSGVDNLDRRQKLGTAAPTAGTWVTGDMVWNAAPAAGGTVGWICVTGGTPGTWKTFGAIAS